MPPSASSERRRTSALLSLGSCAVIVSLKWSSIRISGFRRVIGSWKMRAMSGPRMRRSCLSLTFSRSVSWNST